SVSGVHQQFRHHPDRLYAGQVAIARTSAFLFSWGPTPTRISRDSAPFLRSTDIPCASASSTALSLGHHLAVFKFVADAADGHDEPGRPRQSKLAAHAFDQRIDAASGHERISPPDSAEQRLPIEDDAGVSCEDVKEAELVLRQHERVAVDTHVVAFRIDGEVA